jgi:hypothetical protein
LIDEEFMNVEFDKDEMLSDAEPTKNEINLMKEFNIPRFAYINKDEI